MRTFGTLVSLSLAALPLAQAAPIHTVADTENVIPGSYIVVMKDDLTTETFDNHRNWVSNYNARGSMASRVRGGNHGVQHTYDFGALKGYAGIFDDDTINSIANTPDVAYIEPDRIMRASKIVTQEDAPSWGLGRISHAEAGVADYLYDDTAGSNITFYGVDTGIDITHPDFEDRAEWGTNVVDESDTDDNGHGTHTAGTAAGKEYGVAKKAHIVSVKVLNGQGSGSTSGIIKGMNWCVEHAKSTGVAGKAVMNMSLGGGRAQALDAAAAKAVEAGIFLAVAAGNEGQDAENSSPAAEPSVCTVAATGENDSPPEWSNFGKVVDIYAPGDQIVSAVPGGGSEAMSGTSMASPHVAGVGAYLIGLEGISADAVCDRIKELAKPSVSNPGPNTTNRLLFNGVSE
ncbi:Secreted subtilisin-like serine protease sub5 [Arachnomyces sp. PD_36]|nr:Secreted subtilisin-like serine protease sub5 [Arachnomyces sp. PD_36]